METIKCSKCHVIKLIDCFSWKSKARKKRSTICKECQQKYAKEHYQRNKAIYKTRSFKRTQVCRDLARHFLAEYLSTHPCVDCGESDIRVLDFDHVQPKRKHKRLSRMVVDVCSISRIQQEIRKCVVRCSNCHRKKTTKELKWFRGHYTPINQSAN
jgi:hypothetical protein